VQAPAAHAWLAHATAVPQAPLALQVSTPLPEHCTWPGAQTPVQAPAAHAWLAHATAVPQAPLALQVSTPLPEHCV
jgi:hypothetical protein